MATLPPVALKPQLKLHFGQLNPSEVATILSKTDFKDWAFSSHAIPQDMVIIKAKSNEDGSVDPIVVTSEMTESHVVAKLFQMTEAKTVEGVMKNFSIHGAAPFSPENFNIQDLKALSQTLDVRAKIQKPRAETPEALKDALQQLTQNMTYKNWDYKIKLDGNRPYLQIEFMDVDSDTGEFGLQTSRKYQLSAYMTDSEIIQTALLATIVAEQHEVREYFTYDNARLYGPHTSAEKRLAILNEKPPAPRLQLLG